MIRVWVNRDKLPELEKPLPWLKRVALNETFTWLHQRARHNKLFRPLENDAPLEADAADRVSLHETQEILRQAIEELPPQRKMIYQMSRVQGMKSPEIADALQLSHGYVKNALTAALAFLRERLAAAGKFMSLYFL
jgi:RNA polymerase sigma factor (sigma-70 family)